MLPIVCTQVKNMTALFTILIEANYMDFCPFLFYEY
jgi:hypothetical protein